MDIFNLKAMDAGEFELLGLDDVGYIKPITHEDGLRFMITAADGRQMAEADDMPSAVAALEHFDLEEVSLH